MRKSVLSIAAILMLSLSTPALAGAGGWFVRFTDPSVIIVIIIVAIIAFFVGRRSRG
jgi:hypothetical protein